MTKTIAVCTLGCKVNAYESEAVIEQFKKNGYAIVNFDSYADVYVINTCTVTHLGDRKSRQMIRRTKQINPDAVLVVMGCYAQTAPQEIEKIPEVDLVLGTDKKGLVFSFVEKFLDEHKKESYVTDIGKKTDFEELSVTSYEGKTRAFLKIQDGCNNFCSYCIIPYARGRIRSRDFESSIKEANRLAESGFSEIVLVGIHLASYGKEKGGPYLIDVLEEMSKIEKIKRIRMGSLEPTLFDDEFIERLSHLPKICRHFHLSLQSGCDETLKRMNRKYTTQGYETAVIKIREKFPDAAITTDIMVGFPGETDEEFEKTCNFVKKTAFSDAHIFKYSVRKGTVAEKMKEQVLPDVKEERSHKLIEITEKTKNEFLQKHIGKEEIVLFEREHKGKKGLYEGKTDNYITVLAKCEEDISGEFKKVKILEIKDCMALAEII